MVQELIPLLTASFEKNKYQPKIKFYEGQKGAQKLHEESLLNKEKVIRTIGDYATLRDSISLRYSQRYWTERVKRKIWVKMIDSKKNLDIFRGTPDFSEISNIKKLREVRLVPENFSFKLYILTFDDKVLFLAPTEEGYSFIFESPAFASTIKNWFDLLWQIAEPLKSS